MSQAIEAGLLREALERERLGSSLNFGWGSISAADSTDVPAAPVRRVSSSKQYAETRKRGTIVARKRNWTSVQRARFPIFGEEEENDEPLSDTGNNSEEVEEKETERKDEARKTVRKRKTHYSQEGDDRDDAAASWDSKEEEKEDRQPASGRFLPEFEEFEDFDPVEARTVVRRRPYRQDKYDKEAAPRPVKPDEARELAEQFIRERKAAALERERYHRTPNDEMRDAGVGMRDEDVSMTAGDVSLDDADQLYEKMLQLAITSEKEASDALKINDRHTLTTDPLRDIKHCAGDKRLEAIRYTLNNLGYTRSQFQKLFHTHFIQACLPIIYGTDWATHAERVMKEFGLERISPEVLVQTPRRFGKTVSVAMFVLAVRDTKTAAAPLLACIYHSLSGH